MKYKYILIGLCLVFISGLYFREGPSVDLHSSRKVVASTKTSQPKPLPHINSSLAQSPVTRATPSVNLLASNSQTKTIALEDLKAFKEYTYPAGTPYYIGEKVTAFVEISSTGEKQALTVNQAGEYPRMMTEPGEMVQVRLAFAETAPNTPIAITAHDGGLLDDELRATALLLDEARQLAFSFTVSTNPGIHRVTFRTPAGETKTLEFWAGPFILAEKP